MKKIFSFIMLITIVGISAPKAQVIIGGGGYYGGGYYHGGGYYRPPVRRRPTYIQQRPLPPFQPSVYINIGYGFPNLDKNQLAAFPQTDYMGNVSTQNGPYLGSIDYRFSRYMSIGVLGTYGKITAPYYSYATQSNTPDFTGTLENWSLMVNIMSYIPVYDNHVEPYFRVALGANNVIQQSYQDASGASVPYIDNTSEFAYQLSFGARFKLSPNAGFFLEAGYGKYIASGGLSFKF